MGRFGAQTRTLLSNLDFIELTTLSSSSTGSGSINRGSSSSSIIIILLLLLSLSSHPVAGYAGVASLLQQLINQHPRTNQHLVPLSLPLSLSLVNTQTTHTRAHACQLSALSPPSFTWSPGPRQTV